MGCASLLEQRRLESANERRIEASIVMLCLSHHQRMLFSDLAEALPEYRWQLLFKALGLLSLQRRVTLVPEGWDYEILVRQGPADEPGDYYPRK